ncbi:Dockerin type I repeat protein [Rubripirellula lacrimiformis]|uniref:Dockerin type I repeat protein n=1 Tax=Rubripirellula lacrimiformis TaxID=1930273 RepID=A0A517N9V0_9BACT|nr:tandem-95 repeat protein [Rubripirellula lacrimiformis]QDT03916.1 Dockerin type I repeat protein [Rubripirellula lacrimiformis]
MTKRRTPRRRSSSQTASRSLHHETLEKRELLAAEFGPRLISVATNSGEQFDLAGNNPLFESPREMTFRFDGGQEIDPATLSAFRFTASGGDGGFTEGNEIDIKPGFIGLGESSRIVVARFASALADDQYRVSIAGYDDTAIGLVGLRNTDGDLFQPTTTLDPFSPSQDILMNIEVGPKVVAIVPQPIDHTATPRVQQRDTVHVYFNDDPLGNPATPVIASTGNPSDPSVVRPEFYSLFFTSDTVETGDDGAVHHPVSVVYETALNRATLTFGADLSDFTTDGSGTFRLRVGSSQALPTTLPADNSDLTSDTGDTFADATDLGIAFGAGGDSSITLNGRIEATDGNTIRWPGLDSPGVRDDRRDAQVTGRADTIDGVNVYYYNFANLYGSDASGLPLENAITPAQQQRTREILDLYSQHLGVQFIETADQGLQIVTGDLRALVETATTGPGLPYQEFRVNDLDPTQGVLVLDAGENWFDGYGLSPDARPSWFVEGMRGIGSLLGIGNTFEQVPGVASGSNGALYDASLFPVGGSAADFNIEPDFLSTSDIVPGQALHRPEVRDADLYRFTVAKSGRISIEAFAERLVDTSILDSDLKLWKLNINTGKFDLVARNGDFYGDDSFIGVDVTPDAGGAAATYVLGITAAGNDDYNPNIAGSGGGGRSQGRYDLRISFQNDQSDTITDTNESRLDGDSDGQQGGDFNFWFRVAKTRDTAGVGEARTLFVSARDGFNSLSGGTVTAPLQTIAYALSQAQPGDIVRLLPDTGADGRIDTTFDNRAYEIGRASSGAILADGDILEVPKGVTVMIDAGAILKLRNAKISVGSESIDEDRSLAALQVLGAPTIVDRDGQVIDGTVDITSYREEARGGVLLGADTNLLTTIPTAGDWAGIEFRNDFDYSEGRAVWETEGIFLDYVSHADIRYGGGSVRSSDPSVTPLQMLESRPTLIYNSISHSREAAMSADPNSFAETNFAAPIYQQASLDRFGVNFTSDYDRVGPFIRGNTLLSNSINGLFVRVLTPAGGQTEPMTVSGRFDDADIVHTLSEVLVLQGEPGGPLLLEERPDVVSVTLSPTPGTNIGTLTNGDTLDYRLTLVTREGFESLATDATRTVDVTSSGAVTLSNLPAASDEYSGRRLYRLTSTGDYELVAALDRATSSYIDDGTTRGGLLSDAALAAGTGARLLPRTNARLSVDPGLVVKLESARIETTFGADFYAEGSDGNPVVFTSRRDDRFGAGGTFDTNNDGSAGLPAPGDWAGLVFRQGSTASIDFATISYAGGFSATSGNLAFFNPVEILQADVRIAHSTLSNNADGNDGGGFDIRDSIGFNGPATIFVRGAQPVLVDNTIIDNEGAAISINPDALNYLSIRDHGRGTGVVDLFAADGDNQGPLISANKLDNNSINGLFIRNESLTTESVWDDTDIVHVVEENVYAWNHHHRSGLRLKSDPNQSLVVKLQNGGSLQASKLRTDVSDAIGGTLQVIGQPGFPVILTGISDDSVGAGFTPGGVPQTDTDNAANPATVDWYGLVIQPGTNDRNVAFVTEAERSVGTSSSVNAIPGNAQILGSLAQNEKSSDENRRLGFNVRGSLSQNNDIDVYKFTANGGTEVFIDIDDTDFGLDTVVELIDINGNILALSNSSELESVVSTGPNGLVNNLGDGRVLPLFKTGQDVVENPNPLDAGMRVILPGNSSSANNEYFIRVRSSNLRPNDFPSRLTTSSLVGAGLSSGQYQLSIRLRETDEVAGSTIRLADIRYAFNAIDVPAAPSHSPLAGEHAEELAADGTDVNDGGTGFGGGEGTAQFANGDGDPLGPLSFSDRGTLRVSGVLGNQVLQSNPQFGLLSEQDIDVYRVDLFSNFQEPNIIGENRFVSTTFDIDYADQLGRANTSLAVYDAGGRLVLHSRDSNIADDQGRPTEGNDITNLSAGSAGTLDAYIGPVEMQVGTYYVVVSSSQMIPATLDQMFEANPVATDVRVLPIDSTRRLAEEGFDNVSLRVNSMFESTEFNQLNTAADLPTLTPIFDETSLVPYKLEDVRLFLTLDQGLSGNNQSTVVTLDPFTGKLERTLGQFAQPVGDLAMRRDGELYAYSLGPNSGNQTNGNTGNFLNISSVDGSSSGSGDDGLTLRTNNQANTSTAVDNNQQFLINAMAFVPSTNTSPEAGNNPSIPDGERAYALGNREDGNGFGNPEVPQGLRRNVLYSVVANTGAATNQGSTNGNLDRNFPNAVYSESLGPGSNKVELGIVDTGQFIDSPADPDGNFVDGGSITGMAIDPIQGSNFVYAVSDGGYVYTFQPSSRRTVDVDPLNAGSYSGVINATNHGLVAPDPQDFVSSANGFVQFSSLTLGPRITERAGTNGLGPYAQILFGVTEQGWIYTMEIEQATNRVIPSHILVNGRSSIPITNSSGSQLGVSPTGVAFSIREENLWHQTTDRNGDDHGLFVNPDQSRIRTNGGSSLYFGVEVSGNAAENTIEGGAANGVLNPGGAHGSLVSRPMDLQDYSAGDKPTLYFSYFLETEDGQDYDPPSNGINNQQVDAFRVFAAGDDGQWRLMTTNDTYRSFSNVPSSDEYDYVALNGGTPIQEAFDNTDQWRQARVDLSPLAGHKNVQLRFDFSTAGGMHSQFDLTGQLTEIQAPAGTDLVPGTGFSMFDDTFFGFTSFEFVRGAAVNVPDPTTIVEGQLLEFVDADGLSTTLRLTHGPQTLTTDISIAATDLAVDLALKISDRLQLLAPNLVAVANGSQVTASEARSLTATPTGFDRPTAEQTLPNGNVPIFYHEAMTNKEVRDSIRQSLANGLGNIDPVTGITTATIAQYPEYGTNRIRVFSHYLSNSDADGVGFSTYLPGDEFGAAASLSVSNSQVNARPGQNNNIEGVYLDDIVVGFAERGEVVYNAPVNRNFSVLPEQRTSTFDDTQVPEFPNEILVGSYTLEVRKSSDYGVPEDYDPIRLGLDEQFSLGRSFDTNDRLTDGVTLIAPSAVDLIDGDTFIISNGTNRVTFEFDSDNNVTSGRVRVPFTPVGVGAAFSVDSDESSVVATSIRDAINTAAVRNSIGVRAAGRDGSEVGPATGNRIDLFGSSIQVNPSSGRFLTVDLVDEETFYGRESARLLPSIDHDTQTVNDAIFYDTFARATVTDYVNGNTDTLVAVGKIGDSVGSLDGNVLDARSPQLDSDIVKIYLNAGDSIDVDLDTIGWNLGTSFESSLLEIYQDVNGVPTLVAVTNSLRADGENNDGASILGFQAPASSHYYVRVASTGFGGFPFFGEGLYGEYQLTVRPTGSVTRDVVMVDYHFGFGDTNTFRDQGQLLIESNFIRNFGNAGIRATFDPGTPTNVDDGGFTSTQLDRRPGAVTTLRNPNTDRLLPGAVITNNVIIADAGTGIIFSGEVAGAGDSPVPVPFGRIVNNTVVGNGSGNGIAVSGSASPTILNNIVTNFATGLNISANSASTVVGGNAFQGNGTNSTIAISSTNIVIPTGVQLFEDPTGGIYIPAAGSAVIDSSFSSLNDRSNFVNTVRQPVGIATSPIIAPLFDAYGIPRFDDPDANPGGVGSNVFIDRGAVDRANFLRPIANLVSPLDFIVTSGGSVDGGDIDPSESFVRLTEGNVEFFEIQLTDPAGPGPDARTITRESVLLTENGQRLIPDVDYTFGYSDNSRLIRLTPVAGLWRPDAVYEITLNNRTRIAYQAPSGEEITDGDQVIIGDTDGNRVVFEYESGFAVVVPQTTTLTIEGANNAFVDRETFTIDAPGGNSLTFEFNLVGSTTSGRVPVEIASASTLSQVRDAVLASFDLPAPGAPGQTVREFLNVDPVNVGTDTIQLGILAGHSVTSASPGLTVSDEVDGIADGQTFVYSTSSLSVTFEFDTDGTLSDSTNVAIPFSRTDSPSQIGDAIVAAVRAQPLGLNSAVSSEDGTVVLGGRLGDQVDVDSSSLVLEGSPGVTGSLSLMIPEGETPATLDGDTFTINSAGSNITFIYTLDPNLATSDRLVVLTSGDDVADIAAKSAAAIAEAFPGELFSSFIGDTIFVGEPSSLLSGATTTASGGSAGLVTGGVSGGAIAVNYLPTSPRTSIAATLQGAIAAAPLNVTTFAAGGGTILIANADTLEGTLGGGAAADVGTLTPAITNLSGNPVAETRTNDETRFTIIMPEVVFDLGDAPVSYDTLVADNGARHTIGPQGLPRLGRYIDSEADGQPIGQDDVPLSVTIAPASPGGQPVVFTVDPLSIPDTVLTTLDLMPTGGETLSINIAGTVRTFELVDLNSNPTGSNIPVTFSTAESLSEITTRLVTIIRGAVPQTDDGLLIEKNTDTSFVINAVDDEDGVLQGELIANGTTYSVFTQRGTDPTNVRPEDVLGFLNPQDPAGTNMDIQVFGAGLLHAWIDFDQNGQFEADEQVLANVPVSGDATVGAFNTVTVFTPNNAFHGNTWMRVRISESGNLLPTGVAIGGEVEDYQVQVIAVDLPAPDDDLYAIDEDASLDTLGQGLPSVSDGDIIPAPPQRFLPVQYIVGELPTNGTLVSLDSTTGHFVYQPNPDFNGTDTFTYRLSTQPNESASSIPLNAFATVTIAVAPVNDAPGVSDKPFKALEDLSLTITSSELLTDALADDDASYVPPTGGSGNVDNDALLNEVNQLASLQVVAVQGSGSTPITAANAASAAGSVVVTTAGLGLDLTVTSPTAGDVFSLAFAGKVSTFELVPVDGIAQDATIAVQLVDGDTTSTVATRLAEAIEAEFGTGVPGLTAAATGASIAVSFVPEAVTVGSSNAAVFGVSGVATGQQIDLLAAPTPTAAPTAANPSPAVGDTVTVTIAGQATTFEFVAAGATAATGNVAVPMMVFADPNSAAAIASATTLLGFAIGQELATSNVGVSASVDGLANPNRITLSASNVTAGKSFDTVRGSAIAVFDTAGALIEVRYLSGQDLNRDNPPPATPAWVDQFTYTIRDNGVSVDLVDNLYVYGTPLESAPATVSIDVAPQNDPPRLVSDVISVGPLGPDAANVTTAWETFGGATPTEDQSLTIDPAFLLLNDTRGPLSAADENTATSLNDTGLAVASVTMVDDSQGTVELIGGEIIFTPAANIFGDVVFTYSATDQGINENLAGDRPVGTLTSIDGTVTVSIQPVNDIPVAFDRTINYTESADAGTGDAFVFTRDQLILGSAVETPALPGQFDSALVAPFNETEQTANLQVVSFTTVAGTVDASSLTGIGAETLTLASEQGGTYVFEFTDGVFQRGLLTTAPDYNRTSPFAPDERFSFVISDDGATTDPQGSGSFNLDPARSDADSPTTRATATLVFDSANDAPTFTIPSSNVNVLERDDNLGTTLAGFATSILPGPATATDEAERQSVVFTFPAALNGPSTVPAGLFTQLPTLSPDGHLTVYPAPDAIGTATFVVQADDVDSVTAGFVSRQTLATFTVNVRPVNDAPRFDANLSPRQDTRDADDAYTVANVDSDNDGVIDDATIQYVLREDNTQAMGVVADYFIPLRRVPAVGYSRVGLLDVFTAGPDNEVANQEGGSQTIEFLQAGNDPVAGGLNRTTDRGGVLTPVFDAGVLIGLNYRPPTDFNSSFAGLDSFTYTVRDDNPSGGETYDLIAGGLVPDRLTSSNRVELLLTPVNDRPEFVAATLDISVQEDTQLVTFQNYASNISAGPATTAFDEVDVSNGQLVEFTVTSLDFPREEADDFFSVYPTIDEQTGLLTFRSAANVFGEFRFEVVLSDQNRDGTVSDNTTRGDLISSEPITLTINVNPVNDPPIVDPTSAPLSFTMLEDGLFEILVEGDSTNRGLLDLYFPGPSVGATDESADIAPQPGGNQIVLLGSPVPTTSAQGGSLQYVTDNGAPRLLYRPRANFVGFDSFIYTVIDNGVTVDSSGTAQSDPRIASNTVTFEVLAVNDAPQFSGAGNVGSDEDEGPVSIANWATNVQAGPSTALDELGLMQGSTAPPAQALQFVFTPIAADTDLFLSGPVAVIDPVTGTATLQYETNPNANGTAVFEVVLEDMGPRDSGIGDVFRSTPPRTFAINVVAVNDPPSFTLVQDTITRLEDSGPYSVVQAANISPGPEDELIQTVSFDVEPLAAEYSVLFSEQPTIDASGVLRFTPATNLNTDNINGPVPVRVVARDSAGAVTEAKTFSIVITEVNDAPRAVSDTQASDEDSVLTISVADLLANDIDPDLQSNAGESLMLVMPAESFSVSGARVTYDSIAGTITYDPTDAIALQSLAPQQDLVDSFAYSLVDAAGLISNQTTVAITVDGINDVPMLTADSPTLNPDGPTLISVLDNDVDIDGVIDVSSLRIDLQPAFGSLSIQPDGTLIYTPFSSFGEEDIFRYSVADDLGQRSEVATVTISSNAAPIAGNDASGTFLNESIIIDVVANDSDPNGNLDLASISIVSNPRRGAAVALDDGTIQYLPAVGFVGQDSFQYQILDDEGRPSNVATVNVQVVASRLQNPSEFNDVNDDGFVTAIDALLVINRLARDSDGDGRIPVISTDRGPNYYDVSGDQSITSLDALRVINELSRINTRVSGEFESVAMSQSMVGIDVLKTDSDPTVLTQDLGIADEFGSLADQPATKLIDASNPGDTADSDVIDLIAAERDGEGDRDEVTAVWDAVLTDLN